MSDYDTYIRGTVNEALAQANGVARFGLRAAGFTPVDGQDPNDPAPLGTYNGGIDSRRLSRLQKGDLLFRFSDSRNFDLDGRFSGAWWFDRECLATIRWAARLDNCDFRDAARSYLGILYEWGDMGNLVGGLVNADFWCFRGLTGPISGQQQSASGPFRTDVVQIYVPGGLRLRDFDQPRDNVLTSGLV